MNTPTLKYRCLIRLLSPLVVVYTLWRTYKDGGKRYLRERLGLYDQQSPSAPVDGQTPASIWIHAASVGEVFTVLPLLRTIRTPLLVTTMTPTGAAVLEQQALAHVQHVYLPVDFPGACQRFFQHVDIRQGWIVETEIWPWLYAIASANQIPLTIINARLSDKTSSQSGGFLTTTFQRALHGVRILARSNDDAKRFIELGASDAAVTVVGNLKYANPNTNTNTTATATATANANAGTSVSVDVESPVSEDQSAGRAGLARLMEQTYVLAASTHDDEEQQLALAWCKQQTDDPVDSLLVIAPRHPERGGGIQKQLASLGIRAALRSKHEVPDSDNPIYIADTLGELQAWYAHATVCLVGGSLIERGGHNVLEAARADCPIVVGPHTFNFTDIVQTLISDNALAVASDASSAVAFFRSAIRDPQQFTAMAQRARVQAERSEGVLTEYLKILLPDANDASADCTGL